MSKFFLIILCFLFSMSSDHSMYAQNSFMKSIFAVDNSFQQNFLNISVDLNEDIMLGRLDGSNRMNYRLVNISPEGAIINAFEHRLDTSDYSLWTAKCYNEENYQFISTHFEIGSKYASSLTVINKSSGNYYSKFLSPRFSLISTMFKPATMNEKVFYEHNYTQFGGLGLVCENLPLGNPIWAKQYYNSFLASTAVRFSVTTVDSTPQGNLIAVGRAEKSNVGNRYYNFVVKLDSTGNVIASTNLLNDSLIITGTQIDTDENVYVFGRQTLIAEFVIDTIDGVPVATGIIEDYNGILIKLDNNLGLIWAKEFESNNFPCQSLGIGVNEDSTISFTYTSFADFPAITGYISQGGELLSIKGRNLRGLSPTFGPNKAIYALSIPPASTGDLTTTILFKSYPEEEINGCNSFAACIDIKPTSINTENLTWEVNDQPAPTPVGVFFEPVDYATEDICYDIPFPESTFSLPDSICQNICLTPTDLKSQQANHQVWTIQGPGIDTIIIDTSFQFCFPVPGDYLVEQEIWVLGCSYFFARNILVLPNDLAPALGGDQEVCGATYTLTPTASRPITAWTWADSEPELIRTIEQSGSYLLTYTDGYCIASDTVVIDFIEEAWQAPPLEEIGDTTICRSSGVFKVLPSSPYTDSVFLEEVLVKDSVSLRRAGIYTYTTVINGCSFSSDFELRLESCLAKIYFPNVFSPNSDGFNDFIYPQGKDYEGQEMKIFDRWGSLVFAANTIPFRWDGRIESRLAKQGVYVIYYKYINTRTRKVEEVWQDVMLVR